MMYPMRSSSLRQRWTVRRESEDISSKVSTLGHDVRFLSSACFARINRINFSFPQPDWKRSARISSTSLKLMITPPPASEHFQRGGDRLRLLIGETLLVLQLSGTAWMRLPEWSESVRNSSVRLLCPA